MDNQPPILSIIGLLFVGACAALTALWLESNRFAVSNWGLVIAVLMAVFFACATRALWLLLKWRDRQRGVYIQPVIMNAHNNTVLPNSASIDDPLSVYTLQPGTRYEIKQAFRDFYGNEFPLGERLTFQQRHFLPYDGGHTIVFAERTMYLQEEVNRAILDGFSDYLVAYDG